MDKSMIFFLRNWSGDSEANVDNKQYKTTSNSLINVKSAHTGGPFQEIYIYIYI